MDAIDLLKEMVRVNTVDSRNGDRIIKLVLGYLAKEGGAFTHERVSIDGVKNLIVYTGKKGPAFVLNGHYDVVPATRDGWATNPFEPVERGGFIYGRGTTDMKSGLAAQVSAFARYSRNPRGRAILMVVGDEEKGGFRGTGPLVERLANKEKIARLLIAEPTSQNVLGDISKKGCRGVLWLNVAIKGVPGHASRPLQAKNPIEAAAGLITYLRTAKFPEKSNMVPTTAITTYAHSDSGATNVIPELAELNIDVRYNHGTKPANVVKMIERFIAKTGCRATVKILEDSPYFINKDKGFERIVAKVVKRHTGRRIKFTTVGGSSDARFFSYKGIPVLEFGTRMEGMHGNNERVSIDDVRTLERIIYDVMTSERAR